MIFKNCNTYKVAFVSLLVFLFLMTLVSCAKETA